MMLWAALLESLKTIIYHCKDSHSLYVFFFIFSWMFIEKNTGNCNELPIKWLKFDSQLDLQYNLIDSPLNFSYTFFEMKQTQEMININRWHC